MQGQMHPEERDLIHRTVLDDNPTVVVECGTWYGGGSTLAAARALHAQARGRLHTWEIDPQKMSRAVSAYAEECPELL
ncbi:MAG TPA: hypothetical protein VF184_10310, partial [Phycisphaeraceae bacterium]